MKQTPRLDDVQKRLLTAIFERAAASASQALSIWLSRPVHIEVSAIDDVELADAAEVLGPAEALVAACSMELVGRLTGEILLVFDDAAGLALADLLLNQPLGTSTAWEELEQSAACETANIVGCALLNSLAAHLPALPGTAASEPLVPSPPTFRHEFAGSLLQFALMNQAMRADRVMLARTRFTSDGRALNWSLLYVPGAQTLDALESALGGSVVVNQPERLETISVPIGRWGVARAPTAIRTLLGSCVGVVLYDKAARVGGIAHIVLPDSRGATDQLGRFADTAIPALLAEMGRAMGRSAHGRLSAKIAGGASMFQTGAALNIGQLNCAAVERILGELGMKIEARHVGGATGRHLTLDTRSGIVTIRVPGGADDSI